jgi:hypothetical protein
MAVTDRQEATACVQITGLTGSWKVALPGWGRNRRLARIMSLAGCHRHGAQAGKDRRINECAHAPAHLRGRDRPVNWMNLAAVTTTLETGRGDTQRTPLLLA